MDRDKTGRKEDVYNEGHKVIVALKEPRKAMGSPEKVWTNKEFQQVAVSTRGEEQRQR